MKKKSKFFGMNAKFAFALVAIFGSLLTSCYEKEDLDIKAPTTDVTTPPKYIISGTVYDATTLTALDGASVSLNGTSVTASKGVFRFETAVAGTNTLIVSKGTGYTSRTITVEVATISKGETAVYNIDVALKAVESPAEYGTVNYVLTGSVIDAKTLAAIDADAIVIKSGTTTIATKTGKTFSVAVPAAGTYTVDVTEAGYKVRNVSVEVAAVEAPLGKDSKLTSTTNIEVAMQTTDVATTYIISGNVFDFETLKNIDDATISLAGDPAATATKSGNFFKFIVTKTGTFTLSVVKDGYNNRSYTFDLGSETSVKSIDIALKQLGVGDINIIPTEASTGTITNSTSTGTTNVATTFAVNVPIGAVSSPTSLNIAVIPEQEAAGNSASVLTFIATPDGIVFATPITLSFADAFGGQLGNMSLFYLVNNTWVENTTYPVVLSGGTYTASIPHFCIFKFGFPYTIAVTTTPVEKTYGSETFGIIHNYADVTTDKEITVQFDQYTGTVFDMTEDPLAQFTGFAKTYLKDLIINTIAADNDGIAPTEGSLTKVDKGYSYKVTLAPGQLLYQVKVIRNYEYKTYTFVINGKNIVVKTKKEASILFTPTINLYSDHYGHDDHGHGSDENAGGGIFLPE